MMDWTKEQLCIRCNKGGELLLCNNDCPIAAHGSCLGYLPQFDEDGSFCCPYCVYSQVMKEEDEVRQEALLAKKALFTFLEDVIDCSTQKQTSGVDKQKKCNTSIADPTMISTHSKNYPSSSNVAQHSFHSNENEGEGFPPKNTKSNFPCEETDQLLVQMQNDSSSNGYGGDQVYHGEEGVTKQHEAVENGKRVQTAYTTEVNDHTTETVSEDQARAEHLNAAPIVQEKQKVGRSPKVTVRKRKRLDISKDNESTAVEVHVRDRVQRTRLRSSSRKHKRQPILDLSISTSSSSIQSYSDDDAVSIENRNVRQKNTSVPKPSNSCSRKKSTTESSGGTASEALRCSDIVISSKSRQLIEPSKHLSINQLQNQLLGNMKHYTQWSEDEVEMLKQGYARYSSTVNKNIPWRKILEFGRDVFDPSRSADDLREKWKRMLAKNVH